MFYKKPLFLGDLSNARPTKRRYDVFRHSSYEGKEQVPVVLYLLLYVFLRVVCKLFRIFSLFYSI